MRGTIQSPVLDISRATSAMRPSSMFHRLTTPRNGRTDKAWRARRTASERRNVEGLSNPEGGSSGAACGSGAYAVLFMSRRAMGHAGEHPCRHPPSATRHSPRRRPPWQTSSTLRGRSGPPTDSGHGGKPRLRLVRPVEHAELSTAGIRSGGCGSVQRKNLASLREPDLARVDAHHRLHDDGGGPDVVALDAVGQRGE